MANIRIETDTVSLQHKQSTHSGNTVQNTDQATMPAVYSIPHHTIISNQNTLAVVSDSALVEQPFEPDNNIAHGGSNIPLLDADVVLREVPKEPETLIAKTHIDVLDVVTEETQSRYDDQEDETVCVLPKYSTLGEDDELCEICRVTEAKVDLNKNHDFLTARTLINSLGEYFTHTHFAEEVDGWLFDVYANECFMVTYCLNSKGRDQLRVRWLDPDAEDAHSDYELADMTRRITRLLGGGTNLHLIDRMVPCRRLKVPDYPFVAEEV